MSAETPFLFTARPCNEAVTWAIHALEESGLQVVRTFDLQVARTMSQSDCLCPHHGTQKCDCQMVIILVYPAGKKKRPATIVIHGHDQMNWFYLVDMPPPSFENELERTVRKVLNTENLSTLSWFD